MPKKSFRVEYYRAKFENEPKKVCAVHDTLKALIAKPGLERLRTIGFDDFYLGEYRKVSTDENPSELWFGELRRLRPNDRVAEGNDMVFEDVKLPPNHFIGEFSHFLIEPARRLVLYSGTRTTISWTQFRRYVEAHGDQYGPLVMVYVPTTDAVDRLNKISRIASVIVQCAQPDKWDLKNPNDPSIEFIASAKPFKAERARFEFSIRGRKGKLAIAKSWYKKIFAASSGSTDLLEEFTIAGYEDDSGQPREIIDFLRDKLEDNFMFETTEIASISQFRSNANRFLRQSYDKRKNLIDDTFDL